MAQNELAVMFQSGEACTPDLEAAVRWFARAAQREYPPALYNLARLHERGEGVRFDPAAAARLHARAVAGGDASAAHALGQAYASGWGVERNADEAERLFELARQLEGKVDNCTGKLRKLRSCLGRMF